MIATKEELMDRNNTGGKYQLLSSLFLELII